MRSYLRTPITLLSGVCAALIGWAAPTPTLALDPAQAIITDSRIKTLVYNPNDVYRIVTHFGYQTNVEFGRNEEIQTISLGDRIGWQIIPAGQRLFIRALEDSAETNMTVVTNKRAYQFDLKAVEPGSANNDELVYVARFYYPDEETLRRASTPPAATSAGAANNASANTAAATAPVSLEAIKGAVSAASSYNLNYSFTGPDNYAPLRIFDDGATTFFKLRPAVSGAAPVITLVNPDGSETPARTEAAGEFVKIPTIAKRFSIRYGESVICVFNEAL